MVKLKLVEWVLNEYGVVCGKAKPLTRQCSHNSKDCLTFEYVSRKPIRYFRDRRSSTVPPPMSIDCPSVPASTSERCRGSGRRRDSIRPRCYPAISESVIFLECPVEIKEKLLIASQPGSVNSCTFNALAEMVFSLLPLMVTLLILNGSLPFS